MFVINILRDSNSGKINLGRSGQPIPLVNPGNNSCLSKDVYHLLRMRSGFYNNYNIDFKSSIQNDLLVY